MDKRKYFIKLKYTDLAMTNQGPNIPKYVGSDVFLNYKIDCKHFLNNTINPNHYEKNLSNQTIILTIISSTIYDASTRVFILFVDVKVLLLLVIGG